MRPACAQNYALSSGRRMWALVVFNEGPSVGRGRCFAGPCPNKVMCTLTPTYMHHLCSRSHASLCLMCTWPCE